MKEINWKEKSFEKITPGANKENPLGSLNYPRGLPQIIKTAKQAEIFVND